MTHWRAAGRSPSPSPEGRPSVSPPRATPSSTPPTQGKHAMKILNKVIVFALALAAVRAEARTFEEIKKDGKIIVATEGAYPPFNYFQGPKLAGFEIDLAEALAKKLGVAIERRALSFDALLAGLRQDRWDMVIASFGIPEERSKAASFTKPHYCSGGGLVAR